MASSLRPRLRAAGLDPDAVNVIVKAARRADVPTDLADEWGAGWDDSAVRALLALAPADRLRAVTRRVDEYLQDPANRVRRVAHAAAQTHDPDLRAAGELALDLQDVLTAFGQDVVVAATSPFTGKLRYATLTDIDVATPTAVVEVSTQSDASGKVAQLAVLRSVEANPQGLPVFHLMPNVSPASAPARALRAAGSAGVYNNHPALVAVIRALP